MGITVSGAGEANADPDMVEIDVGVAVLADTVEDATRTAAERAEAVSSALTAGGVRVEDMATTEYSIRPEYDYSSSQQRLLGYRVSNTVRAKLRDIASTGPLLDSIASAGGDETRVNGLSFGVADETSLLASAREAAWNDARNQSRATGGPIRAHTRKGHLHHRDDPGPGGADAEDDGGRHGDVGEGIDPDPAGDIIGDGDAPGGVRLPGVSTLGGIPLALLTLRVATGERN